MYDWRKMTEDERHRAVAARRRVGLPWHSPPHWDLDGERKYLVSAACYEHACIIGADPQRMAECEQWLLEACQKYSTEVSAWCLLPNHYHVLLQTPHIKDLLAELGQLHGRSSYLWNGQDSQRGRRVWYNCVERVMRSEGHFWGSLNYVHHNPVKHGYVKKWQDWPFSSAAAWLDTVGREKAEKIWQSYPLFDYGKDWDNE